MRMSDKQKLIEENMGLVYHIVSREYPTYVYDEDVTQSGMVGLCKAANHWDEARGKFSTYAGKCIRHEIYKEFLSRKSTANTVSLESPRGDDLTLGDTLVGADEVVYLDDKKFYAQLTEDEQSVFDVVNMGFSTKEVAEMFGWSVQKVRTIQRVIKIKWRKFNGG